MGFLLTRNADCLLALLYAQYKRNMKTMEHGKAVMMGDASDLKEKIGTKFSEEELLDFCWELVDNELITGGKYSNTLFSIKLLPAGIAYIENQKAEKRSTIYQEIKEWSSTVASLVSGLGLFGLPPAP